MNILTDFFLLTVVKYYCWLNTNLIQLLFFCFTKVFLLITDDKLLYPYVLPYWANPEARLNSAVSHFLFILWRLIPRSYRIQVDKHHESKQSLIDCSTQFFIFPVAKEDLFDSINMKFWMFLLNCHTRIPYPCTKCEWFLLFFSILSLNVCESLLSLTFNPQYTATVHTFTTLLLLLYLFSLSRFCAFCLLMFYTCTFSKSSSFCHHVFMYIFYIMHILHLPSCICGRVLNNRIVI